MDFNDEGLSPEESRAYRQLMETPGLEFEFEVGRDTATVARDGTGRGFSEASMDALVKHMIGFVATRISRYYNQHDLMPQHMSVRIRVALDHQPRNFDESLERKELPHLLIEKDTDATSQEGS